MTLESSSALFSDRASRIGGSDVQYGIERFLHNQLHTDMVYCRAKDDGRTLIIRAGSPLLVEQILIRIHDIRVYAKEELSCDVAAIRVMLE